MLNNEEKELMSDMMLPDYQLPEKLTFIHAKCLSVIKWCHIVRNWNYRLSISENRALMLRIWPILAVSGSDCGFCSMKLQEKTSCQTCPITRLCRDCFQDWHDNAVCNDAEGRRHAEDMMECIIQIEEDGTLREPATGDKVS